MSKSEASTSRVSEHEEQPLPPLAKIIRLEELEQTVLGIVKQTLKRSPSSQLGKGMIRPEATGVSQA